MPLNNWNNGKNKMRPPNPDIPLAFVSTPSLPGESGHETGYQGWAGLVEELNTIRIGYDLRETRQHGINTKGQVGTELAVQDLELNLKALVFFAFRIFAPPYLFHEVMRTHICASGWHKFEALA